MRARASCCQPASTSGSIASASRVQPCQSRLSSRATWCGLIVPLQSARNRFCSAGLSDSSRQARAIAASASAPRPAGERLGEPQRAGAGLGRPAGEEADDLGRRQVLRASAARRRGAASPAPASRRCGEELLVFRPVAGAVAQPRQSTMSVATRLRVWRRGGGVGPVPGRGASSAWASNGLGGGLRPGGVRRGASARQGGASSRQRG